MLRDLRTGAKARSAKVETGFASDRASTKGYAPHARAVFRPESGGMEGPGNRAGGQQKCLSGRPPGVSPELSFRGACEAREPGIHTPQMGLWIPGPPLRAAIFKLTPASPT
jgi:hypothetical protein